jgi:hypothetical protein
MQFVNVFVSFDRFKEPIESRLFQFHSLKLQLFNGIGRVREEGLPDELGGLGLHLGVA